MLLYRISHGLWEVFAVCDSDGNSQVMDTLVTLQNGTKAQASLAVKMRQLLEKWVPSQPQGPQTHNTNISKKLTDNIFEFKKGAKKGPKIRVLWFYGDGKRVVCTICFLKTNEIKQKDLDDAEDIRKEYYKDLAAGNITEVGE